jgi:hypothetical protein
MTEEGKQFREDSNRSIFRNFKTRQFWPGFLCAVEAFTSPWVESGCAAHNKGAMISRYDDKIIFKSDGSDQLH